MTEETKSFPIRLSANYVPGSIIEFCHFRNLNLDADERAAIYLEDVSMVLNLKNMKLGILPNYDGDETENEKVIKFNDAENRSERFGVQFLIRKNNIGDWDEEVEIICLNRGRKDYISLLQPFFTKYAVRMLEANDAFAIRLIDYGFGLLKSTDTLKINMGVKIEISKKNDTEALEARLAAIELALEGKLINLSAETLLGRDATTGTVMQIPQSRFATPSMIDQAIMDLGGGAPGALNTLKELASALNNDANFASNIINLLATKVDTINNQIVNGNKDFSGFTALGSGVGVKQMILPFTSPAVSTGPAVLNGQLPAVDKIIGLTSWLRASDTDYFPPNTFTASRLYANWYSIHFFNKN